MLQDNLLTILSLLPVLGALALIGHGLFWKRENDYRWIALLFSVINFALSLILLTRIPENSDAAFRFEQKTTWIAAIGANYHIGVDGISLWLVILTTLLVPISILSSWNSIKKRSLSFYVFMLILESAMMPTSINRLPTAV